MKAWLVYTLARLGIFVVALVVLLVIGLPWYWAAIGGALIGLLVSYIALPGLRGAVTTSIAERRARPERDADSDFEDDFVDTADATGTSDVSDASDTDLTLRKRPDED